MRSRILKLFSTLLAVAAVLTFAASCDMTGTEPSDGDGHTHDFGEWKPEDPATCTEDGKEIRECECGETEERAIPATGEHDFGEWKEKSVATCSKDGKEIRECECGETEERVIPATGKHVYGTDNACTSCGESLVFTAGLTYAATDDGESYIITAAPDETEIVIPPYHEGKPIVGIGDGAFSNKSTVKSVSVPETVTVIGRGAFAGCTALTGIELPASLRSIGEGAFEGCTVIVIIVIPEGVTDIGAGAFRGCESLESVTVPSGITEIKENTFEGCESLSDVELPDTLEKIGEAAFKDCTVIVIIVLPEGVSEIGAGAFSGCAALEKINIPEGVSRILEETFKNCVSLARLLLPDGLREIASGAFFGCSALEKVEGGNLETVAPDAFDGCERLDEAPHVHTFGDWQSAVAADCETDGTLGYYYCAGCECYFAEDKMTVLESLTVPALGHDLGEWKEEIPAKCKETGTKGHYECSSCGKYFDNGKNEIESLAVPANGHTYENGECSVCGSEEVSEGLTFETVNANTCYVSGRGNCTDTVIIIPSEYEGKTVIGVSADAFRDHSDITKVELPETVTVIGSYAFKGCESLTSVYIPSGVTAIGYSAFEGCKKLVKISVPSGVEYINDRTFSGCYALADVELGEGLKVIGMYAFASCAFEDIEIPSTVTSIRQYAFYRCENLKEIAVPEGVNTIEAYTFTNCKALTKVTMPSVTVIEDYAFSSCTSLVTVVLGENVQEISDNAFSGCTSLAVVPHTHHIDYNWVSASAAGCTEDGVIGHYGCTGCDKKLDADGRELETTVDPAKGHSFGELVPEQLPTCEKDGNVEYYYCGRCFNYYDKDEKLLETVVIATEGHNYGVWNGQVDATCKESGTLGHYLCDACGTAFDADKNPLESTLIPATGKHSFGEWQEIAAPTCKDEGKEERTCSVCSDKDERAIGVTEDHKWGEWSKTKDPTCLEGEKSRICSVCEKANTLAIAPVESHELDQTNTCSKCRTTITASEGLEFALNATSDGYIVSGGTAKGDIVIPTYYESLPVVEIAQDAFNGGVYSVVIPEHIQTIGKGAFKGCTTLKTVYFNAISCANFSDSGNGSSYDNRVFTGVYAIDLVIGSKVERLPANMFYNNYYLNYTASPNGSYGPIVNSITVKNGSALSEVTELFRNDSQCLTSIYVTDLETWLRVSKCFYEFFNPHRYSYGIPQDLATLYLNGEEIIELVIPEGITEIGDYAFAWCTKLNSVSLPESLKTIGAHAFSNCTALKEVKIPSGVISIGDGAFSGCDALTVIDISADSKLESIGESAFSSCINLTSILLPSGLTSIGSGAFYNCFKLVEIYDLSDALTVTAGSDSYGGVALYARTVHTSIEVESGIVTVGDFIFVVNGDSVTLVAYTGSAKNVILPDGYQGKTYEIGASAFEGTNVEFLTVSSYVTKIAPYAFRYAENLVSVRFEKGSRLTEIGEYAFYYCESLRSLYIPASVTKVGQYACYEAGKSLKIFSAASSKPSGWDSNWNRYDVHNLNYRADTIWGVSEDNMIYSENMEFILGAEGVTLHVYYGVGTFIAIPEKITADGVEYPVYGLAGGALATQGVWHYIYIPSSVKSVNTSLYLLTDAPSKPAGWTVSSSANYCYYGFDETTAALVDGVLLYSAPGSATASVITYIGKSERMVIPSKVTIGGVERNVTQIVWSAFKSLDFEYAFIPNTVTTIGESAFTGCASLRKVEFEENSTLNLISYSAFVNCTALSEITLPSSLTQIYGGVFSGCTSLKKMVIPSSVTSIGSGIFAGCSSLEELELPFVGNKLQKTTDTYQSTFGTVFGTSKFDGAVEVSQSYKYSSSTYKENTYYIPASLKRVRIENGPLVYGSFQNCTMIEALELGSGVTSVDSYAINQVNSNMYIYCEGSLTISGYKCFTGAYGYAWHGDMHFILTKDGAMLASVRNGLTEIDLPATVMIRGEERTVVGVVNSAFYKDNTITSFKAKEGFTSIGASAFYYCTALAELVLPESVTIIEQSVFYGCTALTELVLPEGITILGQNAFRGCTGLVDISFPSTLTQIGAYAFYGCTSLEELVLPEGVTDIGTYAFYDCSGLKSVVLPESLGRIGRYAFSGCNSLVSAEFKATDGWYYTSSSSYTSGSKVSVQNTETAAKYLRNTYKNYYWYRAV